MRFTLTVKTTVERTWECERCHTRGTTMVRTRGEAEIRTGVGGWGEDTVDPSEEIERQVQDRATGILRLVKCPTCDQRAPGTVSWSVARALFIGFGLMAAVAVLTKTVPWEWPPLELVGVGAAAFAIAGAAESRRWLEAKRARTQLTGLRVPPGVGIPKAIARRARRPSHPALPAASTLALPAPASSTVQPVASTLALPAPASSTAQPVASTVHGSTPHGRSEGSASWPLSASRQSLPLDAPTPPPAVDAKPDDPPVVPGEPRYLR
jgi:hypothetical protein